MRPETLPAHHPSRPQGRFSLKIRKISARLALNTAVPEKRRITGPIRSTSTNPGLSPNDLVDLNDLTSMHTSAPLPVPPTVSFLPLSFAQSRRDIRERKEGFEMERNSTPFAIRAHSLIPLDVAFARDDIRRRYIGSESPTTLTSSPSPLNHDDTAAAGWKDSISNSPMRTPLKPMFFVPATSPNSGSPAPSTPSVYSPSRSWIDMSKEDSSGGNADISWSYDSLVAVYSKENGYSDDEGSGEKMLASLSSDSFDEASFIRMAEDCLGW